MIRSAKQYQISELFSPEKNIQYYIPKFQRQFKWRIETSNILFDDLIDNSEGYFLGSIICINKVSDTYTEPQTLELIDGQQRLVIISLLYATIYGQFLTGSIEGIPNKDDLLYEDFITEKNNLKNKLIQKGKTNQLKIELSTQGNNLEDYKYIMKELGLYKDPSLSRPPKLGNRRLYKTYKNFKEKLSETEFNYKKILDLLNKINQALLVKIEVENSADAFMLFESLNNRGEPLSPMDLIKNRLLGTLEKERGGSIDESFNRWQVIITNLIDYQTQERFLRHYYNAFKYKSSIGIIKLSKVTRSNLIKVYEELIVANANYIFEELITKSKIYNIFIDPKEDGEYSELYQFFLDLQHIGSAPSYILLLYLFSEYFNEKNLLKKILEFLVKYFVRRNLTDSPGTRTLDKIFIDLVEECEKYKGSLTPDVIIKFLTHETRFSNLIDFQAKLEGNIYETNRDVARFILTKIEEVNFTKESRKDLWKKDKNKYIWTIEHILPKGKSLHKDWIDIIASGDEKRAEELKSQYTHKLGNLTITAYNPNLSNSPFLIKKNKSIIDKLTGETRYIGFKNKLFLNEKIGIKDAWTIKDIEERTKNLLKFALDLFSIEGET